MPQFQIFDDRQIQSLRKGGKILRECLTYVAKLVAPGITTKALDNAAETFIRDHGGLPGFKGYKGFPATLCTSVNEECVHGIPGERLLKEGDIISLDAGVLLDDLYTDACITVAVGEASPDALRLIQYTDDALVAALRVIRTGIHIGDISAAIQEIVEGGGYTVLRALTGHGLGTNLHQYPDIPNFGASGKGPTIPFHTILAIEPIVSAGKSSGITEGGDGWTLKTKDGALSAHMEHTVLIIQNGCEILA
ncbi:type I methionyl aminopeptidase [Candidatus Peregrinibacteria bacterium]|nr:type I methionyl aminopeptidase [Candidatus Peregrinibacteria bacterium]